MHFIGPIRVLCLIWYYLLSRAREGYQEPKDAFPANFLARPLWGGTGEIGNINRLEGKKEGAFGEVKRQGAFSRVSTDKLIRGEQGVEDRPAGSLR